MTCDKCGSKAKAEYNWIICEDCGYAKHQSMNKENSILNRDVVTLSSQRKFIPTNNPGTK